MLEITEQADEQQGLSLVMARSAEAQPPQVHVLQKEI
jgi:hypothetical protein